MTNTHTLLRLYDDAYQRTFSLPAPILWAKDGTLAKRLLERYTLEQLTPLLAHFFVIEDAFIQQSGYTFGVFVACLGKVIADQHRQSAKDAQAQMLRDYHAQRQQRRDGQDEERARFGKHG